MNEKPITTMRRNQIYHGNREHIAETFVRWAVALPGADCFARPKGVVPVLFRSREQARSYAKEANNSDRGARWKPRKVRVVVEEMND